MAIVALCQCGLLQFRNAVLRFSHLFKADSQSGRAISQCISVNFATVSGLCAVRVPIPAHSMLIYCNTTSRLYDLSSAGFGT